MIHMEGLHHLPVALLQLWSFNAPLFGFALKLIVYSSHLLLCVRIPLSFITYRAELPTAWVTQGLRRKQAP